MLKRVILQFSEQVGNISVALQEEIEQVTTANVQLKIVERGVMECQHGFEILLDALVHVAQGTFQPQSVTAERIRAIVTSQQSPNCLNYPNFPFSELQRIIVPHIYAYNQYLVYALDIPLFSSIPFYLYKMLPYPVYKNSDVFTFILPAKDYIFVDNLKRQFGKITDELTSKLIT